MEVCSSLTRLLEEDINVAMIIETPLDLAIAADSKNSTLCMFFSHDYIIIGSDYFGVPSSLTFMAQSSKECFNVTLIDDQTPENDEVVSIRIVFGTDNFVLPGMITKVDILIIDNDGKLKKITAIYCYCECL